MLIVALDANFRLKNRMKSNEVVDPGLHTGRAYFVEQEPYMEHLRQYSTQVEVSTTTLYLFSTLMVCRPAPVVGSEHWPRLKPNSLQECAILGSECVYAPATSLSVRTGWEIYRRVKSE